MTDYDELARRAELGDLAVKPPAWRWGDRHLDAKGVPRLFARACPKTSRTRCSSSRRRSSGRSPRSYAMRYLLTSARGEEGHARASTPVRIVLEAIGG